MRSPQHKNEVLWFWIFLAPALLGFLLLTLGPMLYSFYLSFTIYNAVDAPEYIGLRNYDYLVNSDPSFWISLKVTFVYTLFFVPANLVVSLLVAMLLNVKSKVIGIYRTIYFLPSILPAAASAMIWVWIFNPRFGLLNEFLGVLGIKGPAWINSDTWALPALVIMATWGFGGTMLIFLSGLQGIPRALLESAEIDGATFWHRFFHITLPILSPVIFFNLVMSIIGALRVFDQAFVFGMAGPGVAGGPARATLFYVLNLYQKAFTYFHMGLASAMAWILFIIILLVTLLNFYLRRLWVYQEVD